MAFDTESVAIKPQTDYWHRSAKQRPSSLMSSSKLWQPFLYPHIQKTIERPNNNHLQWNNTLALVCTTPCYHILYCTILWLYHVQSFSIRKFFHELWMSHDLHKVYMHQYDVKLLDDILYKHIKARTFICSWPLLPWVVANCPWWIMPCGNQVWRTGVIRNPTSALFGTPFQNFLGFLVPTCQIVSASQDTRPG